ncbi:VOC family protein [Inquilinus sp. CAU 1745]|uniref:VOC family protein n=1 Tax=Inquilinus sp. CAU 1745 TaxID=3140369 RepID=UPI00325C303F
MSNTATKDRPEAMQPLKGGVVPYLTLPDAAAAIDFYGKALGAEEVGSRHHMDDGRILNSRIDVNGGSIMLMDPMPEHGKPADSDSGLMLHLHVDDADRWFDRAVAAGCTVLMPMDLQFWGDRYGMVKDPYGISWSFGTTPE